MSRSLTPRTIFAGLMALALAGLLIVLLAASPRPLQAQAVAPTQAQAPLACAPDGLQNSGAVYRICMPTLTPWNRVLVVYAHGYVDPTRPVAIPEEQMGVPGLSIPETITFLGYAFAASSYSVNGLAVQEGVADLLDLVGIFTEKHGAPDRVLLVGVSEGGLITALSVEAYPQVYAGGLAVCGPLGGLGPQTAYFGDFRAVFDYFFPGLLAGSPVAIPQELIDQWTDVFTATVRPAILDPANQDKVDQLLAVTGAPTDPARPESREETIERLLWYNVWATNDGVVKLGGNPFDNMTRVYSGSADDGALNAGVARFSADPGIAEILAAQYTPAGRLEAPLITAHTTGDPVVPYFHQTLYTQKVQAAGSQRFHVAISSPVYGHCTLSPEALVAAFAELEERVARPYRVYVPVVAR